MSKIKQFWSLDLIDIWFTAVNCFVEFHVYFSLLQKLFFSTFVRLMLILMQKTPTRIFSKRKAKRWILPKPIEFQMVSLKNLSGTLLKAWMPNISELGEQRF